VHLAGFGFLYHDRPDYSDPSYCRQWITSPISNLTAPDALIQFVNVSSYLNSAPDQKQIYYHDPSAPASQILYYSGMDASVMGNPKAVWNRRNFLLVAENSSNRGLIGRLVFERDYSHAGSDFIVYTDQVPAVA
jgi:hypothetical protein